MVEVRAELVTKVSKKTGNSFTALEITFSNGYKKLVFLDNAETYMISGLSIK